MSGNDTTFLITRCIGQLYLEVCAVILKFTYKLLLFLKFLKHLLEKTMASSSSSNSVWDEAINEHLSSGTIGLPMVAYEP